MILTIGVPTYLRDIELMNLLGEIDRQLQNKFLNENVEVLISINGINEQTYLNLLKFQERFFIRTIRNETNIGYDLNVLNLFRNASAEHLLLLSDDDYISNNLIYEVVENIREFGKERIFICNQYHYSEDFTQRLGQEHFFSKLKHDRSLSLKTLDLKQEFFAGLSGLVLPVNDVNKLNLSKFIGTNWIQLAIVFQLIKIYPIHIISKAEIKYRILNKNRSWHQQTNNISIRYLYKKFKNLDTNFIEFGYRKYNHAVQSNLFHRHSDFSIDLKFFFGGSKSLFYLLVDLSLFVLHYTRRVFSKLTENS
jgi:hypothetical protein